MIDIQQILRDRQLTIYAAAQQIAAVRGETLKAVHVRLSRWAKGNPPNLTTVETDLDALGLKIVVIAK
jgi:hypothetical protein